MARSLFFSSLIGLIMIGSISACKNKDLDESSFIAHPLKENIPYYNRDHVLIHASGSDLDTSLPAQLVSIHNYLASPDKYKKTSLDALVSGNDVDIASLSPTQVVILDKPSDNFFVYDLSTNTSSSLAEQGRGPGDIAFVQEMVLIDSTIYVAMEDMRVSEFICQLQKCEYEKTISLDYSAVSIAKVDSNYAVLSQSLLRENATPEIERKAVRIIEDSGNEKNSFGYFYETDHWIVLFSIRGGFVRYSENLKKFILAFKGLPLIYVFDEELEIAQTYKFEEYLQGKIMFNSVLNAASPPTHNMTTIKRLEIIDGNYLFINTTTVFEMDNENTSTNSRFRHDYYALDLNSHESYYLGREQSNTESVIYPLDKNLMLNQDGKLFNIELE